MHEDDIILTARFNPKAKQYYVVSSCIAWVCSIFGILLLPIWIPIAMHLSNRWFNSLECVLTEKKLHFKKGILVRVEKTVPLDKITDLGSMQGPVMRAHDIEMMTIETAGNAVPGAALSLPGLIDPQGFREAVLAQKEKLMLSSPGASEEAPPLATSIPIEQNKEMLIVLREIRDSLQNLEKRQS